YCGGCGGLLHCADRRRHRSRFQLSRIELRAGSTIPIFGQRGALSRRMRMAPVRAPTDWMELPDWDRYWSEVLADKFWTAANMKSWKFEQTSLRYLEGVRERNGHRVLLAGNGIAPEPYGFAHAGCDVTVVEVSAVACQFLGSLEVSPGLLAPMFPEYD